MFLGWIQNGNWSEAKNWWTVQDNYGFFHVYAFTMTLGVILAVGVSAIKLYRKGVPLTELWIGAAAIVPLSLFGASFFGKLNANGIGQNAGGASFFGLFAFWEGGMAIHGGVYTGTFFGVIIFYFLSKRTKVSLWVYADAIIPNILLGQAVGRWGNFFNHEIFGMPVAEWNNGNTSALNWLPNFIRTNMVWTYTGDGEKLNGLTLERGHDYLMSPIFLYEAFGLLLAWILITFVIANIGKWFGKKPDYLIEKKVNNKNISLKVKFADFWFDIKKIFNKNLRNTESNSNLIKTANWKIWKNEVYANHKYKEIDLYKEQVNNISDKNYFVRKWKQGKLLSDCNNPQKYMLIRSGVQAGSYFFAWNLVRFVLELGRPDDHLFLMYQRTLSLTIIGLSMFVGLAIALLSQFVFPYLFRTTGLIYEQEYFYVEKGAGIVKQIKPKKESKTKISKIEKNKIKEQRIKEKLDKKLGKK
ncbi:prolipoprotein diacylglyceryl transferase [Spiroplasma sp. BIUS-1]|uniref:prolipoprotein diacylglyceryl transferase n=1 Tax=Spiroplasma sp. BIUS-1 TaxID=216964 RepID=UPI0013982CEB|nr:prolipoprotein diacylglyceryl transferase family protein [Spiroplasma sp. BIUS-1]QHX36320.1 prolipoprotein diacylglyceryl transferase [Spiroplasma sp. BIUS-1]